MGGKKKQQAQRTKNNAKPSSSGRATELMSTNVVAIKTSGDSSFSANLSQISSVSVDLLDPSIDPNFQVALKKMSKKDSVTRCKALSEFIILCNDSDEEAIKSALPFWIRLYCVLVLDIEHRIRETAHNAHNAVVSKVGRNLAPYMKQIAPYWFISQYDTYAPAASAASNSFKAAFPPHKQVDVIVFCQPEIIQYIANIILVHTPETICTNERTIKEDLEAKYERILISSLKGYAFYLSKISKQHLEKVHDVNMNIISSNKFWKLAKHKSGTVRAAWFSLLSSVLQFAPNLIENEHKRVTNTVFGRIDDYDAVALPYVWEAALLIVTGIKDCWQDINMEKFFIPKFRNILAQGGQGNASFIYPNIILLLSNIPEAVMKDKITFFGKIFSSFEKGLGQPCVTQSQSESESVATSLIECIQYLIMIYTDDTAFCNYLMEEHIMEVLSNTMLESLHHHLMNPLYSSLVQMLLQWKNRESTNKNYKHFTENFWIKLVSICKNNINKCLLDKGALAYLFDSNIKMMDHFNNRKCRRKKDLKVKFSANEKQSEDSKLVTIESLNDSELILQDDVIMAMKELIHEYFKIARNYESYEIRVLAIKQLWKIITVFKNEQIIKIMDGYEIDLCNGFYDWIKDIKITTESLVGVIFATIDHIQNDELKNGILLELVKERPKDAILESAKLINNYDNKTLRKWMKSSIVKDELCSLCNNFNEDFSVDVLHYCLKSDAINGFIVGEETVLSLLSVLIRQLKSGTICDYKNLAKILDSFFGYNTPNCLNNYKSVLLQILYLCFEKIISGTHWDSLFSVWRKGIHSLATVIGPEDTLLIEHVTQCADFVAKYINDNDATYELNLTLIIKISLNLISTIVQQNSENVSKIGIEISKIFLDSVIKKSLNIHQENIESLCYNTEIIYGNIISSDDEESLVNAMVILNEKWDPLKDINLISYIRSLLFCVKYLLYLIDDSLAEDDLEIEDESQCSIPPFNITEMNDLAHISLTLCYGLTLSNTVKRYFQDTKQFFIIGDYIGNIQKLLKELVHRLNPDQQIQLQQMARQLSLTSGKQWSQTLSIISVDFLDVDDELPTRSTSIDLNLSFEDGINIEYLRALRSDIIHKCTLNVDISTILDSLIVAYKKQFSTSNLNAVSEHNYHRLKLDSEVAMLLNALINCLSAEIDKSKSGWDFIMVSLATWMSNSVSLTKSISYYKEYVIFAVAVCDLYINFILHLLKYKKETKMFEEWRDVFLSDTCEYIGAAWEFMANLSLSNNLNYIGAIHLIKLSEAVHINCQAADIRQSYVNDDKYELWLNRGQQYITSPCIPVQITAFKVLLTIVPLMVKLDSVCDENELQKLTCKNLKTQFIETQNVVTTMLQDISLGVSCSVTPFTDSYTYTLGYIFLWSVLLEMCKQGDSQIRYIYTLWIKEMNLIVHVMESMLKLMPNSVLHCIEGNVKKKLDKFIEMPLFTFDVWGSERLSDFCCWLFCDLLRTLPAVARQWAAEVDPKLLSYADKITISYVSSALCAEEMKAIMNQQKAFDNMKVTTHPSVREVVAVYTVEESSTELVITLAKDHPLTPPKVEIPKAMISSNQTRQWLMQLTIFLTHQNGSIWDGLLLWKSNLDKKFEGIEECYICFSILHNTSHQLPKLSCQTCKKKFHSFCLYKWFTTSNKSTCPICRNHF